MRIDLHTHVVPARWDDWAARFGGGQWPRLEAKDPCHVTIMTGDQFFRDVDDRCWDPARRIEDVDRLGDSLTLSAPNLRFILDVLGPERVVIGSDYPFDMGLDDPVGFLAGAGLDAAVRAGIEHANAVRFLGLA